MSRDGFAPGFPRALPPAIPGGLSLTGPLVSDPPPLRHLLRARHVVGAGPLPSCRPPPEPPLSPPLPLAPVLPPPRCSSPWARGPPGLGFGTPFSPSSVVSFSKCHLMPGLFFTLHGGIQLFQVTTSSASSPNPDCPLPIPLTRDRPAPSLKPKDSCPSLSSRGASAWLDPWIPLQGSPSPHSSNHLFLQWLS